MPQHAYHVDVTPERTADVQSQPSANPWIVVNTKYEGYKLEVKLFSNYSRVVTVTGLFAFATLLAYWTLRVFTALVVARFHSAMAFVAFSSLLVLLLLGYACCLLAWLDALSLEVLTVDATEARIQHITPMRSLLARMTGTVPKCSREVVLHSRHLQAEIVAYPIRSLTGYEEARALEIAPGVRFGNYYLEEEQLEVLQSGINAFLQFAGHRPALGGASCLIMEPPKPSRVSRQYKDKDRVHFAVSPSGWSIGVLLLFAYEMAMGFLGVLYAAYFTMSDHRFDHLIVAMPLLLLSLLFLVVTAAFTFMLVSALADDVIEVDKETVVVNKVHWLPCGGVADSYLASGAPDVRAPKGPGLGSEAEIAYEDGVPVLQVHGHTVAHGASLDDLAWMKSEVDAVLSGYALPI